MKKRQVVFSLMLLIMVCVFSFMAVSAAELKIMSYDFTAGANAADVYTIANSESPDIIGAQACVKTVVDHFNANGYREMYKPGIYTISYRVSSTANIRSYLDFFATSKTGETSNAKTESANEVSLDQQIPGSSGDSQ